MKKILILFLIFGVAAGAFGQFSWRLDADFNTRLVSWMMPTGERSEKTIQIGNDSRFNGSAYNPAAGRGDYTYSTGSFDLLSYGNGNLMRMNELWLRLDYRLRPFEFRTRIGLDNLALSTATANQGTGQNELAGGHSFVQGSGRTPNWGDILRYSFNQWFIRGTFGFLSAYVGNTDENGKVTEFSSAITDDVLSGVLVERFGLITPVTNTTDFQEQYINSFYRTARTRTPQNNGIFNQNEPFMYYNVPYLMVGARVEKFSFPLTFQIAADAGYNNMTGAVLDYKNISGGFRVSGENVANRITFEVVYKIKGGDPDTMDINDQQPDGKGLLTHVFGVYANILNVPDFGIGFGYSGYLKVFEDTLGTTGTTTKSGPLFSGIDLRLQYTGIKNAAVTLCNNVSFSNVRKSSVDDVFIGVWGQDLPPDNMQSWFALYNAIGINYRLSRQLIASFQVANRYGIVTTVVEPPAGNAYGYKMSQLRLGGGGYAAYQFNRNVLLQGGITFLYMNSAYSNSQTGAQIDPAKRDANGGTFGFAFPIRVRFLFRS